jgi:hypothetical protein
MASQSHLIDLDQYPVHQCTSKTYQSLLKQVRNDLATDGCFVLKGFLTAAGVKALCKEADAVSGQGHKSFNSTPLFQQRRPNPCGGSPCTSVL